MRALACLSLLLLCTLAPPPAAAADASAGASAGAAADDSLQVASPFIELHTGPGRGYPVFHVAARGERVVIELRRTDWFRVRTEGGRVGWVPRAQIETTLTAAGTARTFRDVLVDDYLQRRVEFGASYGRFESEPLLKIWAGWRFSESLGLEASVGQVQGVFSGSDFWHAGLNIEPWSDQRWSPFFGVGLGRLRNVPNSSLVDARTVDAQLAVAQLGLRWHLSERFTGRIDYSLYTAFVADTRSTEYRALSLGLSFFF